jgi:hypothetical protein
MKRLCQKNQGPFAPANPHNRAGWPIHQSKDPWTAQEATL